nr:MAG TPA: hypothetical protein [Caudoviricetes sp.]
MPFCFLTFFLFGNVYVTCNTNVSRETWNNVIGLFYAS